MKDSNEVLKGLSRKDIFFKENVFKWKVNTHYLEILSGKIQKKELQW